MLLLLLLLLLLVIFYTKIIFICYYFLIIIELLSVKLSVTTVNAHLGAWLTGEKHILLVYIYIILHGILFILTLHFNRLFCSNDIVML